MASRNGRTNRTKIEEMPEIVEAAMESDKHAAPFPPDKLHIGIAIAHQLGINPDDLKQTYKGTAIADFLGVDESQIRKFHIELRDGVYQSCPELLREGKDYTEIAFGELFLMRQHRMKTKLLLNSKGQIVREAPLADKELGRPVQFENQNRLSKKAFLEKRWEEVPQLVPGYRDDSLEAYHSEIEEEDAIASGDGAIVPHSLEKPQVFDGEHVADFDDTLDNIEELGGSFQGFLTTINENAQLSADVVSAQWARAFQERFQGNVEQVFTNLGAAMDLSKSPSGSNRRSNGENKTS